MGRLCPHNAASRRRGLSKNKLPALSCATVDFSSSPSYAQRYPPVPSNQTPRCSLSLRGRKTSAQHEGECHDESSRSRSIRLGAFRGCRIGPGYPSYGYGPYAAPLYDYAGPASPGAGPRASHRYSPLIYAPQLYAPTPAFPAPPAEPGYYTVQSVVVSPPLHDYKPGYWGR